MLENLMRKTNNYFFRSKKFGEFSIVDGILDQKPPNCHYFWVYGSNLNDGLHHQDDVLEDESFTGYVVSSSPPKAFLALSQKIEAWAETYKPSEFQSETILDWSYTKASGEAETGWAQAFKSDVAMFSMLPLPWESKVYHLPDWGE